MAEEYIRLICACGKKLRAPVSYAGREAKCPACGRTIPIPLFSSNTSSAPVPPAHPQQTGAKGINRLGAVVLSLGCIVFICCIALIIIIGTMSEKNKEEEFQPREWTQNLQAPREKTEKPKQTKKRTPPVTAHLKAVSWKFAGLGEINGKRALYVTVKNISDKRYVGKLEIEARDESGHFVESWILTKSITLDPGLEFYPKVWTRKYPRILYFTLREQGKFEKVKSAVPPQISYKEIFSEKFSMGITVLLYLPSQNKNEVQQVIDYYEGRFPNAKILSLFFSDSRECADNEGAGINSDNWYENKSFWDGNYASYVNKNLKWKDD